MASWSEEATTTSLTAPESPPTVGDVRLIHLLNKGNAKGAVYELGLETSDLFDLAVFHRAAGLQVDGHFHTGRDPSFAPQRIYCLAGQMLLTCEDLHGHHETVQLVAGTQVEVPSFIWYGYQVLQDVVLAETRRQAFDPAAPDTYDRASFDQLRKLLV